MLNIVLLWISLNSACIGSCFISISAKTFMDDPHRPEAYTPPLIAGTFCFVFALIVAVFV